MKNDIIIGRNPVLEAIRAGRTIDKIFLKSGDIDGSLKKIAGAAKDNGIIIQRADRRKLDTLADDGNHQGVVALCAVHEYASVEDILSSAKYKGEAPFVVICDKITDPHNLGSIIRTANAAGAHGVIIPKHESVTLNSTVLKVSAGAAEFTPVARVSNLAKTIDDLKNAGVWVTGTCADAEKSIYDSDFSGAVAICIGSEGNGLSRLVKEKCDFLVNIPMKGETESLNASVAAALVLYEVFKAHNLN
ncbi:MAG: 23S rRNA (guanosine(2251)-2'-O)-methyltransferase RlmB [Clostridia bacterium]|nr:23S rRNA (guanosine(2251)-2'-O)-methyltransferase RlmB [Clostridia bacterium]